MSTVLVGLVNMQLCVWDNRYKVVLKSDNSMSQTDRPISRWLTSYSHVVKNSQSFLKDLNIILVLIIQTDTVKCNPPHKS